MLNLHGTFAAGRGKVSTQEKRSSFVWGLQHVGMLANLFPACATPPILSLKENTEWVQLCVDLREQSVFFFNINEFQ